MQTKMNTRVETWCGYKIRFVEKDGRWWASLDNICWALGTSPEEMERELPPSVFARVETESKDGSWDFVAINEEGIYQIILKSQVFEANGFRLWSSEVMKKLRSMTGLQEYEVLRMLDSDVQGNINDILDTIFYDEETGKLMRSVTVAGGDVEQVEFSIGMVSPFDF